LIHLVQNTQNVRLHDERNGTFVVALKDEGQSKHVYVHPPDQVKEIRNAFPDNNLPTNFEALSPEQINILYQHSGSFVALALGKIDQVEPINTEAGQLMIEKLKKDVGHCFGPLNKAHPTMVKVFNEFREDDLARSVKVLLQPDKKETVIINYGGTHNMSRAFNKVGLEIERNEIEDPNNSGENIRVQDKDRTLLDDLKLGLENYHLLGKHLLCRGKLKVGKFGQALDDAAREMERLDNLHSKSEKPEK
jgi:hypothetical protein